MRINVHLEERGIPPLPAHMRAIIRQVISRGLRIRAKSVSISIVSAEEMTTINHQYRNINDVTDVLSFPGTAQNALGDIILCLPVAGAQATEYNHSLERELAFLTAHGLLHLLGHDHQTPEEEEKMIQAQNKILQGMIL